MSAPIGALFLALNEVANKAETPGKAISQIAGTLAAFAKRKTHTIGQAKATIALILGEASGTLDAVAAREVETQS